VGSLRSARADGHYRPTLASLTLAVVAALVAACGEAAQEGPCFAPGEPCGTGFCSQSAYCDPTQQCVPKLQDGAACTDASQCTGAQCLSNACAGGPLVCTG